jgi:predicted enzyme related to lactoylglutathione lyase
MKRPFFALLILLLAGTALADEPAPRKDGPVMVQYLEIVTPDTEALCATYEAAIGAVFGDPVPALGNARIADMPDGSKLGIRAPMHESEEPAVRPYWLVEDIQAAWVAALASGAEEAHPPLEIPGQGTFAIFKRDGIHHGLWQN